MSRERIDKYNLKIGLRLLQLRKSRHLTQIALAKRMGITFQQVQKYESGLNQISLVRLHSLARAFNISDIKLFQYLMATDDPESDKLAEKLRKFPPMVQASLWRIATFLDCKIE